MLPEQPPLSLAVLAALGLAAVSDCGPRDEHAHANSPAEARAKMLALGVLPSDVAAALQGAGSA